MVCKFCGQERTLVRAHIIPRSFYPFDPEGREPMRLAIPGRPAIRSPIGEYDSNLLCEACERRFTGWDDHACEVLNDPHRWQKFEDDGVSCLFTENWRFRELKLFILSVYWKAAATERPMFGQVSNDRWTRRAKILLENDDPGNEDEFSCFFTYYENLEFGPMIFDPRPRMLCGIKHYRFYFGRFTAYMKVSNFYSPFPFSAWILRPNQTLYALGRDFITSSERRAVTRMAMQELARGH